MKLHQVAVQLYTLRDHLQTPAEIAASLKKVASIGFQAVEIAGLGPISEAELFAMLQGEGLVVASAHQAGKSILSETQSVIDRLGRLECKIVAYPYPEGYDFSDRSQVERLAAELNTAGRLLHEAGLQLSYHNHALEFVRIGDATALDLLYSATDARYLQAELDTYWVQYGGGNPAAWCRKMAGRLPAVHLKDYQITAGQQPTFGEIGYGNLDWKEIIAAAEESNCQWFIVEQDTCPGDPFESLRKSFDYIQAHLC